MTTQNTVATIRLAATADLTGIGMLIEPYINSQVLMPRTTDELQKLMQHGYVAEMDGLIVGFAAIEIYSRKLAELQCLAVAQQVQDQGIGRQLIQRCVERARENSVHELMAITASDEIFKMCGFEYALPDQKRALFIHPSATDQR